MVNSNTVIVDRSSQAADPRLEKTTNSRSPDIQEINEDIHQTHKIYLQNCGTVYMPLTVDSFNARGVRMENCGNNFPQVTYHRPKIIGNERVIHSQSHAVSSGGPQNATGPPTALTEIATGKSNHSNVDRQMNVLSLLQSPQPISPSHLSGDNTHHNIKYLEQLLDSSLATIAVIQFSGNTLADVLTPRAYDTFKALYALAALDVPASASATKPTESEISTRSTFSDIANDYLYSSNHSPPSLNPSLVVSRNGRIHISISVDYVMLFSWAGLVALSILVVFFNLPQLCAKISS